MLDSEMTAAVVLGIFMVLGCQADDLFSFFESKVCMKELGCFSAGSPFYNMFERPLSLLPDDREEINTVFQLYTPRSPQSHLNFSNTDKSVDTMGQSTFDPSRNTSFVIPGYMSGSETEWKLPLVKAILAATGNNVFLVDWSGGDGPMYEQAVANTRVVGAEIAVLIQKMQASLGVKPESIHLIGHSLGSHIAGYAGKRVKNLGRITAMDPAGPYFTGVNALVRLDRKDALFVDAIHSNAAYSRFQGNEGTFDFCICK